MLIILWLCIVGLRLIGVLLGEVESLLLPVVPMLIWFWLLSAAGPPKLVFKPTIPKSDAFLYFV